MTKKLLTFLTLLTLFFGVGWAEEHTVTIDVNSIGATGSYTTRTANIGGYSFTADQVFKATGDNAGTMQFNRKTGSGARNADVYNTTPIPGLKSVTINYKTLKAGNFYSGTSNKPTSNSQSISNSESEGSVTYNVSNGNQYFYIKTTNTGVYYINSIVVTYEDGSSTQDPAATPTFNPGTGTYTEAQTVTITSTTSGATIYYTTNGDDPTTSSSSIANGGTVTVSESCTLKAIAVASGYNNSAVGEAIYSINSGSSETVFQRITDTNDLEAGKRYIFVYETTPAVMGAISTTNTKYGMSYAGTDNIILQSNKATILDGSNAKFLTLGGNAINGWTFSLDGNTLNWTSGNSLNTGNTGNLWTISFTGNNVIISNNNDADRQIGYNYTSSQLRFATYDWPNLTSGSSIARISLFKEVEPAGLYSITKVCNPVAGGSITCSKNSSNGNEAISFTVSTNNNYEFAYVEVKDANNNTVEVTETNGTYSFTMPTSDVTITAHFNQAGTLYILGEANGKFDNADWQPNEGTLMTYSNGKYTARVYFKGYTKYNDGDGFSEFAFSKKLATKNAANGGWDEINWDGSRYGSGAQGSYWGIGGEGQSAFGTTIPLYNHSQKSYRVPAGVYDIEVDLQANPNTVKVTPVDLTVTLDPASGTFNKGKEIAISSNLTAIVAATGSNETVLIQHKIADGEYENGNSVVLNDAGENITVTGKATLGHIEATGTGTYNIENKYTVTIADGISNGQVSVSSNNVAPGTEVTITATPSAGYSLGSITVTDASDNPITVTDGKFIMPESNVVVSATFTINSYSITTVPTNCSVDVASTGVYNSQVTFTVTPRSDKYEVSTVTVTYGDGRTKPVTDNGDGTYSFYMPDDNVTLTVICTRKSTGGNQFTLVKSQTDIVAGGEYVMLSEDDEVALKTNTDNYDNYSTTFTHPSNEVVKLNDENTVAILKLADGNPSGTFTMQDGSKFLTAANKKLNATTSGSNWTITYSNGSFTISAPVSGTTYYLRYNNQSGQFRCYTGSTGIGVKLYKRLPAGVDVELEPATCNVIGSQLVSVGSNTDGAVVRYKVEKQNGANWDVVTDWTNWTEYTAANGPVEFIVPSTGVGNVGDVYKVTAQAKDPEQEVEPGEEEDYEEAIATYTFVAPNAPTINPGTGSMSSETQNVTITSDYADGTIEYSTDGGNTWKTYTSAFQVIVEGVGESVTVQARVTVNGVTSEVATAIYTRGVQPVVFSPASGTYYDDQTCQMFSTSKNARIYYTTNGSEPSMTNGTLYTGEVPMPATGTYQFKAVAYIGNTASTVTSANYNIKPRSEGTGYDDDYLLFNVAELNAVSFPSGSHQTANSYTMVNPVQVVWMSTYQNNGYYPEYCLIRDNTGYGMLYFGYKNSYHAGDSIYYMGDWIKGGYNGKVSLAWSSEHGQLDTHPEMGTSGSGTKIYGWNEGLFMSNSTVLPEYITIPEILASDPTDASNDYWGHYVHLRKNTVALTEKDEDGKWTGTITDENGNQINYYDKFYLQRTENWSVSDNFFTGHPRRTFDIYGFVACHLPADIDYQISPFAFAWIDKPIISHATDTYYEPQTVTISSPDDSDATIWYKTSEMDDYAVYTEPFTVNSTTTIEWYATKQSQYNDELESLGGSITMTFEEIAKPVITPESQVKAVGESVDASIAYEAGVTVADGAVIMYTTDGSDPKTSETAQQYTLGTTLNFTTTTTVRAITKVGNLYSAEADAKTYTFVKSNGIEYTLVTDVRNLNENGVYVIVSQNYNEALSTTQNDANRGAAGVMFVEDTNKAKVYGNDDVAQFTLKVLTHDEDTSPERHFLMQTNNSNVNGYLHVGHDVNNTLMTEAEEDALGNDVAVITIDADGRAHIHFNYSGGDNRYLQYWNRDRLFSTYKSEFDDRAVYIYGVNATPLATIEKEGVTGNQYTIADELIAVHYVSIDDYAYLWCKDQGNVSIAKTEKKANQIDYMREVSHAQSADWDQSNWVVLKFKPTSDLLTSITGAVDHYLKPASITGTYTDDVNFTITMPEGEGLASGAMGDAVTYTPNVFSPANFLESNLTLTAESTGAQGNSPNTQDNYYFFMNPKIQEVATVTYAVWNGSDGFVIPKPQGNINAENLNGAFTVNWKYNNGTGSAPTTLTTTDAYRFKAAVQRVGTGYGPHKAQVSGKEGVTPSENFIIYPLDLTADANQIVTSIKDVADVTGKAVAGVKYYNLAGMESDRPFEGVNIIVTTYTDGSRSSQKVLK